MAKNDSRGRSGGYEALRAAIKAGVPANLYIFYGEERYLLQNMVQQLKELLIPGGFEEFNYHRLGGKGLTVQELASRLRIWTSSSWTRDSGRRSSSCCQISRPTAPWCFCTSRCPTSGTGR